ncbi:MAG: ABC transporter ATP-binding protein [Clostridiales bacterium]|uniref:ABC transporter ATP-binding protein n=2 Tax=Terrisporobacter sp. TaxID=1965305 RepID=UPI002A512AE9|nr:ABC transporter ATP-binding protein [Terrisporobacter sp.]MDD7754690.1 ABC transporter ATP-binding protein [Clostridiales bacterium]MDY4133767.1 ABC transporter ATP-binding protein [Terrisporobacter sp.]MDY4734916.1 ABC transporter ATP-binding protein [Terrisporobacter sp.]
MDILKVENLKKVYIKDKNEFTAVNNVDLNIKEGECVGLVGESGCGKSSIARMITNLERHSGGDIFINGINMQEFNKKKELYKQVQMIFQNPLDSFNPRIKLGNSIGEIKVNLGYNKREIKKEVIELLEKVGLSEDYYYRYPKEVSGGQCQRAAIARALLIKPKLLICDEPTSALDVSVQGQIINLLNDIKEKTKTSFLFISHDLALVQNFCDKIYVMYEGEIVEKGTRDQIINSPTHPYTKLLLSSNFSIYEDDEYFMEEFDKFDMNIEIIHDGCKFYGRCPFRSEICKEKETKLKEISNGHFTSCHMV